MTGMASNTASTGRRLRLSRADGKLALAHLIVAFTALGLGAMAGLLQALVRSGGITLPAWMDYYQLLTAHGVLMALVFTTFFIFGFLHAGLGLTLSPNGETQPGVRMLSWASFWLMLIGVATALVPIIQGQASVLYTFYAPMKAAPPFYIGVTLLIVGTWIGGLAVYQQYRHWRRANPDATTPLFAFMAIVTLLMWQIGTLGIAASMVLQLIPWSLGWIPTVNVLLTRTLFWFFGHPLVYFWLFPAYIAWYVVMPKLIGGKVFSDPLARVAFLMLLLFSIPVGLHHQMMDPGIDSRYKLVQVGMTYVVIIPSLMTAFAMFATMERAGRARGYGGLFGWLKGLPWKDARFLAMFLSMALFIPAGIGGMIQASYSLNALVHNTLWVTGHFHLTVATAVALTFMGVGYWLVPHATGRTLTPRVNRLALFQVWLWAIGMTIMAGAMHIVGVMGEPRRTAYVSYPKSEHVGASWHTLNVALGVGGSMLFLSAMLAIGLMAWLAFRAPRGESEFVLAQPVQPAARLPRLMDRWSIWLAAAGVLILAAYVPPVVHILRMAPPGSKPFVTYRAAATKGVHRHAAEVVLGNDPATLAGRKLFSQTCGGCHTLADAKTTGTVGPVLDGMKLSVDRVAHQIEVGGGAMPGGLLTGIDAQKVTLYVSAASGGTGAPGDGKK